MEGGGDDTLEAIWGSGPGDVYAVASDGGILHLAGLAWRPLVTRTGGSFTGVGGSGPGDVWAVGADGMIQHHQGSGWLEPELVAGEGLFSIWSAGPDLVIAVGLEGSIVHRTLGPCRGPTRRAWTSRSCTAPGRRTCSPPVGRARCSTSTGPAGARCAG
jgi:hypothetical protein